MATEYSKTQVNNTQSENNVIIINDNSTVNIAIDTLNNNDVNSMERNNDTSDVIKSSNQYKSLQECFITNYNIFKEKLLDERIATTNVNTKIDKNLYTTIYLIIKEHLESLEQVDYWVLNVSVYTAAYTIKQYVGELKDTTLTQTKNNKLPKSYHHYFYSHKKNITRSTSITT